MVETLLSGEGWTSRAVAHARAAGPDQLHGGENLVECLSTRPRPIPTIDHAIHLIEIMEAAASPAATGHAIELDTIFA